MTDSSMQINEVQLRLWWAFVTQNYSLFEIKYEEYRWKQIKKWETSHCASLIRDKKQKEKDKSMHLMNLNSPIVYVSGLVCTCFIKYDHLEKTEKPKGASSCSAKYKVSNWALD